VDRAEPRFAPNPGGDRLIDRRSSRPVVGERRAGGDAADRLVVAVARPGRGGRLVIQAAEHVDIVAERRQRGGAAGLPGSLLSGRY